MEPHFRNYQINHNFEEKDSGYYCWKLKKKRKVKHKPEPSVQSAGRAIAVVETL